MFSVGWNVHKITGLHFYNTIFESKPRCTSQNNHPFVLLLIVPEANWRNMSVGNYPFNADMVICGNDFNEFFGN